MPIPASIIIPTLNEEKYLPLLLQSLTAITSPIDIIVVDGKSVDGTFSVAQGFTDYFTGASSLRVLTTDKRNISWQRNIGAQSARYPLLIFMDADVAVPSALVFERMIAEFSQRRYVIGAPLLVPSERDSLGFVILTIAHIFQYFWILFGRPYLPGSCIVTMREVFQKIDGFDSSLLLGEDVDYALRAAREGRAGLLHTRLPVSMRRFKKYGYGRVFTDWMRASLIVMFQGKIGPQNKFDYPFGEF